MPTGPRVNTTGLAQGLIIQGCEHKSEDVSTYSHFMEIFKNRANRMQILASEHNFQKSSRAISPSHVALAQAALSLCGKPLFTNAF